MSSLARTERSVLEHLDLYIGGQWVTAADGRRFETIDPYVGHGWASVADAGPADVDRAVQAAQDAFAGPWGKMTGAQRARLMIRLAEIVERDISELAKVETRDNGKLIRDAEAQVAQLPQWLRYFAGLADKINGEAISDAHPNFFVYTRREPIGVVAGILPWNAPLVLMMFKLAPALAAGCTFIAKPSEFTPASTLEFAKRVDEAGFPPGVFNVLSSSARETGASLVAHKGINKVAFTGSVQTGVAVAQAAAAHLAPTTLELGGKSPQLIFDDADLFAAVNGVVAGIFAATGQMCHAGSRVLVQRTIFSEVVDRVVARARQIKLGDPSLPETEMGPISTGNQFARVKDLLKSALQEGAVAACGGKADPELGGFFVQPTVLTNVRPEMRVMREEVFGPVVGMMAFDTEDEGVAIANDTRYGLAAGIWTNDIRRVHRVAKRLQTGTVWVNSYRAAAPSVPFGGQKASGIGRENGINSINEFTETKAIWVELSGERRDPFRIG